MGALKIFYEWRQIRTIKGYSEAKQRSEEQPRGVISGYLWDKGAPGA